MLRPRPLNIHRVPQKGDHRSILGIVLRIRKMGQMTSKVLKHFCPLSKAQDDLLYFMAFIHTISSLLREPYFQLNHHHLQEPTKSVSMLLQHYNYYKSISISPTSDLTTHFLIQYHILYIVSFVFLALYTICWIFFFLVGNFF